MTHLQLTNRSQAQLDVNIWNNFLSYIDFKCLINFGFLDYKNGLCCCCWKNKIKCILANYQQQALFVADGITNLGKKCFIKLVLDFLVRPKGMWVPTGFLNKGITRTHKMIRKNPDKNYNELFDVCCQAAAAAAAALQFTAS